jgi:hypothetical protein
MCNFKQLVILGTTKSNPHRPKNHILKGTNKIKEKKMNDQIQNEKQLETRKSSTSAVVPGLALILIGLLIFAGQWIKEDWIGLLFLPALGIIFLAWGMISKKVGLIVPGGILSGIGAGAILVQGPFANLSGEATGGVFMIAFAAGFLLIPLFAAFIDGKFHWWPLIPAGFMAIIGAALLIGGTALQVLEMANYLWPLALIAIGLYLILWRRGVQR